MRPGRYLPAMAALLFGMIAVPAHAATIQITMQDLVFAPAEVAAKVGDTIEWINKDAFVHTATARNGDFDVNIAPKKTVAANAAGPGASTARNPATIMTMPNIVTQRATR